MIVSIAAPPPVVEPPARRLGRVTLVGAGPGGADLITLRGARALATADVVVYDRLADPELLDLAPHAARRIEVGKAKGWGISQDDINEILVHEARAGAHVVRLKGGDPFVFGRGSEECDALATAGIQCEVVPGVSSALAAPALFGVPLTHRGESASFTVLSGHRVADADHDWSALARSGSTVVVLMAASTAGDVAARLIAAVVRPTSPWPSSTAPVTRMRPRSARRSVRSPQRAARCLPRAWSSSARSPDASSGPPPRSVGSRQVD